FLQALEVEEFEALPAPVYVRGFLRSYANYLGLEPQSLLDELRGNPTVAGGPEAFVRGPSRGQPGGDLPSRSSDPFRARPATQEAPATSMVIPPRPARDAEWDPDDGYDDAAEGAVIYDDDPAPYRAGPVPGVLVERPYSPGPARNAGMMLLIGAAAVIGLFVIVAVVALGGGGGDDDGGLLPLGGDETATPTSTGGQNQTVIPVGSPTPGNGTP